MPEHPTPELLARVVSAKIHPAIGVARVGNSPRDFYIGPEVPEPPPTPDGATRDKKGAIKREAARFRVYGYDADGAAIVELTSAIAEITWTAHLCNKKPAWYRFDAAMDLPEMAHTSVPLRNPTVADRSEVTIDPGPRSVSGPAADPTTWTRARSWRRPATAGGTARRCPGACG